MPVDLLTAEGSAPVDLLAGGPVDLLAAETPEAKSTRLRAALPETLNFAGMDTGIPINEELAAYLTTLGAGMSGSYRGAKQILGLDKDQEALNQANINALSDIPGLTGTMATAGSFMGAGLDPVTLALPISKAKSLLDMAKYGAAGGAAAGALQPIAEGGSRAVNAATGTVAGAVMSPVIGAVASRFKMPIRAPRESAAIEGQAVKVPPVETKQTPAQIIDEYMAVRAGYATATNSDSRVVLYHASPKEFLQFDKQAATPTGLGGAGHYFSDKMPNRDTGAYGKYVISVEVPKSKLADLSVVEKNPEIKNIKNVDEWLKSNGYEGTYNPSTGEYVIFDPNKFNPYKTRGSINPSLAAQMGGATVGAATGAATADEGAPPAEIASRALLGGLGGWQLAKFGADKIIGIKIKPSTVAIGNIPTKATSQANKIEVVGDAAEPLFQKEMSTPLHKKITLLATEYYESGGVRDPKLLVSDDIAMKLGMGDIAPEMAAKYGITPEEISGVFRTSITDHARAMAYLSHVSRSLNMTKEEGEAIAKAGAALEDAAYVRPLWKKVTDTWRAMLVTQPATAVRNAISQAGRIGLDVIQAPLDSWIQKLTGRPQTAHPMDGLEEVFSLFQKNKDNTDLILKSFPDAKRRMFQTYLSDVTTATGQPAEGAFWTGVNKVVDVANILNRTQEFVIRRALFQSKLAQEMRNRGKDLATIIKTNAIDSIPEDAIKAATKNALDKTFAETPAWGTMSKKLIDAVNAVPGAALAMPFPRFMYNAIRFQYEFSPMGILSYLSKAERAAFAAGDVQKVSKAVIGTAMLGAAFGVRNADNAGEKWYEWTKDNGDVVDLRPFNPFASYLFVADVLKRQRDGTLYKLSGSDIAQGLLSTNMRAGTGLYLLDNAVTLMSKSANDKKLSTKGAELTGDFLAGFFTPLNVMRDAYDQFTDGQSVMRDTRSESFLGPIKNRIPVVSQTLPEAELPTREGPKISKDPLLRQATGLFISGPKNAFEVELDRLGFERSEILPNTGDHELDVKYARAMGAVAQRFLVPLADSDKFQSLDDSVKGVVLHEAIAGVRQEVTKAVNATLPPEKRMEMQLKKQTPRLKYLLQDFGVMP